MAVLHKDKYIERLNETVIDHPLPGWQQDGHCKLDVQSLQRAESGCPRVHVTSGSAVNSAY